MNFFRTIKVPNWRLVLFIVPWMLTGLSLQLVVAKLPIPDCGIRDFPQDFFIPVNEFLRSHKKIAEAVLISTSLWFDFCFSFLIIRSFWQGSVRSALALLLFGSMRQTLQILVGLPLPANILWYAPHFPSLFVSYGISNDLFVSAHTGISLLGAMELARLGKRWLTILAYILFIYLSTTTLVLAIHYTTDVYAAILTAIVCKILADRFHERIDRFLTPS